MENKKNEMHALLEKSKATDMSVLLSAKEKAKRLAMEDPTATNLSAYRQASQMLEAVMEEQKNLKDYRAVLNYAKDENRKLGQSKLYEDISKAKLKKQPDGSFKIRDVDKYLQSLPPISHKDSDVFKAASRQKEKEEAEIRRLKAVAAKEEFDLARKQGEYIAKSQVHTELASRAILIASSIKTAFEANSIELVEAVDGNPKKSTQLIQKLENIFDEALNEYAREMTFDMQFSFDDTENNLSDE